MISCLLEETVQKIKIVLFGEEYEEIASELENSKIQDNSKRMVCTKMSRRDRKRIIGPIKSKHTNLNTLDFVIVQKSLLHVLQKTHRDKMAIDIVRIHLFHPRPLCSLMNSLITDK